MGSARPSSAPTPCQAQRDGDWPQFLPPPFQQAPAATEVQPAKHPAWGAEKARRLLVALQTVPWVSAGWRAQTRSSGTEAMGPDEGTCPQQEARGKLEVLPKPSRGVGKAGSSSAAFPEAGPRHAALTVLTGTARGRRDIPSPGQPRPASSGWLPAVPSLPSVQGVLGFNHSPSANAQHRG